MRGSRRCSVALWTRETSNQFQKQQEADALPGCGVTGYLLSVPVRILVCIFVVQIRDFPDTFVELWASFQWWIPFTLGHVLWWRNWLTCQLVALELQLYMNRSKSFYCVCLIFSRKYFISALGGEYKAAPESVYFKLKLCHCFVCFAFSHHLCVYLQLFCTVLTPFF